MEELKECARLVESVAEQLDVRCRIWKETLDRAYKDGKYNQNTGLWEIDECKVSRARYTLDAYRDALSMVDTLGQQMDDLLRHPAPENKALTCEGCVYEKRPRYMARCTHCARHPAYTDRYEAGKPEED